MQGIFKRQTNPGANNGLMGSSASVSVRKRLMIFPSPCHIIISTKEKDMKLVMFGSAFVDWMLAKGCGKAWVGVQGMLDQ